MIKNITDEIVGKKVCCLKENCLFDVSVAPNAEIYVPIKPFIELFNGSVWDQFRNMIMIKVDTYEPVYIESAIEENNFERQICLPLGKLQEFMDEVDISILTPDFDGGIITEFLYWYEVLIPHIEELRTIPYPAVKTNLLPNIAFAEVASFLKIDRKPQDIRELLYVSGVRDRVSDGEKWFLGEDISKLFGSNLDQDIIEWVSVDNIKSLPFAESMDVRYSNLEGLREILRMHPESVVKGIMRKYLDF